VIVWWRRGRLEWRRDVVPLLPWFVVGAASGLFTAHVERTQIGAQGADFTLGAMECVLLAGRVVWFYLAKLVWPANLSFVYPRWTIDATDAAQYVAPLAVITVLVALAFWSRRNRAPLAIALLFGGTLFPVLGFVNVFPFIFSYVADHFQYLASIAIIAFIAAALTRLPRRLALIGATSVVVTLGALTWSQSREYRDVITLYEATLARNPAAWMAHNNLGMVLVQSGRAGEAEAHFQAALRLRANYAEGENNLGDCLTRLNRAAEAVPHLERALRLHPRYPEAHNNLGAAFMALDRRAEGVAQFEAAVQLKPDYAVAQFNLGLATASGGRPAEAIAHFEQALRAQPDYAEAELNWAIALTVTQRFAEAERHFERAVQLRPDYAEAQMMFGRGLTTVGRLDEAISHFQRAIEIDPGYAAAHLNLALALRQTGRLREAEEHLAEAQRLGARGR
jgi:protein O-mannosyl-transferase